MTNGEALRSLGPRIAVKIGFPLLIGLVALLSARLGGMTVGDALALDAAVTVGCALALLIVDTELRPARASATPAEEEIMASQPAGRAPVFSGQLGAPGTPVTDLLQVASHADERGNPLLEQLARRELDRAAAFARQLPVGGEITYEGEDRDWLLGLTREAKRSIDAISLSTVDAGQAGLDSGLWTSDLGIRYIDLQREAIARRVRIRRVFVFADVKLASDESVYPITQEQRDIGVEVRMLDRENIPSWLQRMIFDFIVFDRSVTYETTPVTPPPPAKESPRPGMLRTQLAPLPDRVRELSERFELLWEFADPDRKIDN